MTMRTRLLTTASLLVWISLGLTNAALSAGTETEGRARPRFINLGRTSLAAVTASSMSDDRAMDNIYYGVTNAFDDGVNWHNNINYSYWLPGQPDGGAWAEIRFDSPVTIRSVSVENAPPFTVRLWHADGELTRRTQDHLELEPPLEEVGRVRVIFELDRKKRTEIEEIRIIGLVPEGIEFKVGKPRVLASKRNFQRKATEEFRVWTQKWLAPDRKNVIERGDLIIHTYYCDDVAVCRVTVDKRDGSYKTTPLAAPVRIEEKDEEAAEEVNFVLFVSNQSSAINPVDIAVYIDGKLVVDEKFDVGGGRKSPQHNWKEFEFHLPKGRHKLRAISRNEKVELEKEFEIKQRHWAVVDFWYYPETHRNPTPRHFRFGFQDKPIYFQ